jgi:hypothetical protein
MCREEIQQQVYIINFTQIFKLESNLKLAKNKATTGLWTRWNVYQSRLVTSDKKYLWQLSECMAYFAFDTYKSRSQRSTTMLLCETALALVTFSFIFDRAVVGLEGSSKSDSFDKVASNKSYHTIDEWDRSNFIIYILTSCLKLLMRYWELCNLCG